MPILYLDNYHRTEKLLAGIYQVRKPPWWIISGVLESDILAAYQFKNAISETNAYYNLVNPSAYLLTKNDSSVTWSSDKGVFIPAIRGAGLTGFNRDYITCAIKFSDVDVNADTEIGLSSPIDGYHLFAKVAVSTDYYYKTPGFSQATANGQNQSRSTESMANGVLGYTRSLNKLYQNGQLKSVTTYVWNNADVGYLVSIGNGTRSGAYNHTFGTVYIQAAIFYSVALSDAQHVELAEKMNAI